MQFKRYSIDVRFDEGWPTKVAELTRGAIAFQIIPAVNSTESDTLVLAFPDEKPDVCLDEHKAIERMKEAVEISEDDSEQGHIAADRVLRNFVADAGFKRLAEVYDSVEKWYD